jgi:hypothetical protein
MSNLEILKTLFSAKKAVKYDLIKEKLNHVSEISIRKYLKQLGAQSSINRNSRFYILPTQHSFDERGLLYLKEVVFHRDNTLLKAIVSIVEQSEKGLRTAEIDECLKTKTRFQLTQLHKKNKLSRDGNRGVNGYTYYSSDEATQTRQKTQRKELAKQQEQKLQEIESSLDKRENLAESDVIEVMLTLINHPDFSAKSVALSLQRRGYSCSVELVKNIFKVYGLSGKKF